MIIHYGNKEYDLTGDILDSSTAYRQLKGEDSVTLNFSLDTFVDFPLGSWVEYPKNSKRIYTLEKPENFKKKGSEHFEYTLILESEEAKLRKRRVREKTGASFSRLKFSLTAKPREHLQLLVENLNARDVDKGWEIGTVVDAVEKTISYAHNNCKEALQMIAEAFDTEYSIDRKIINVCKIEYYKDNPLPLSYGRGNGFKPGVGRSNFNDKMPIEILYVQGGERNINSDTYKSSELLLPKGQRLIYEDREYIASADGLSIKQYLKDIVFNNEDSLDCPEIYPNKEHVVTGFECIDEKSKWDIFDANNTVDYSIKGCRIAGETATVIFQSGMLAGKEFELKQTESSITGYIHNEKRFKLVSQDIDGQTMPNKTYTPKVGDKFRVFHINLPAEYISDAEMNMFKEAARYLYENENPQFAFTGDLDGIWAKRHWNDSINVGEKIKVGAYVLFSDTQFHKEGTKIRIVGIKESINNPYSPTIELSNVPVSSSITSELDKIESNEVVVDNNYKGAIQFAKRRYRDAKETISMLEESLLDNFTNSINPVAVQTMSMLVGEESLQFRFVDNMTKPNTKPHSVNFNTELNKLKADAGIIQHMTLGIKTISSEHSVSEYKFWSLAEYNSDYLEPTAKYWLYAKVTDNCRPITPYSSYTGVFERSKEAIKMDSDIGYYYLLIGVLNSEYDGVRGDFVPLYGFTEILPGRVTTDKIVSSDGLNFLDFINNAFRIGNDKTFLEFNRKGDGKLRLKGTIIQSESGDENPIGVFRGVYNSNYIYFRSDEVTYEINGKTSTYRFIHETPSKDIAPTNSMYWQIVASSGGNGEDGKGIEFIFKRQNSEIAPATPATSQADDYIPTDWTDDQQGVIPSAQYEFVSKRTKSKDSWSVFSTPKIWAKYSFDGSDGNFSEYRYSVNGSRITPPALTVDVANPSGWDTSMPIVGSLKYLWMTVANKKATGVLVTNWSEPTRITPYDGTDGSNGTIGPAMTYRGVYSSTKTYYGNSTRVDAVKYNNTYYVARVDANSISNIIPTDTSKWNNFGAQFESIATELLLAEGANIAGLIFRNGRLESQNGSIFIDGNTGEVRLTGTMQYSTGYSGNYSDVNVFYIPKTTSQKHITMGYEKSDIGKVCRLFNSNDFGGHDCLVSLATFGIDEGITNATFGTINARLSPQEALEVTCFEMPPNSLGSYPVCAKWTITGRFGVDNFKSSQAMGRFPRMLAMGRITGTSNSVSISGTLYDGRALSSVFNATRKGEGFYRVSFTSGLLPFGYKIMMTGYGSTNMKGCANNCTSTYFDIYVSDDSSGNDGVVEIFIFAPDWEYSLD